MFFFELRVLLVRPLSIILGLLSAKMVDNESIFYNILIFIFFCVNFSVVFLAEEMGLDPCSTGDSKLKQG